MRGALIGHTLRGFKAVMYWVPSDIVGACDVDRVCRLESTLRL